MTAKSLLKASLAGLALFLIFFHETALSGRTYFAGDLLYYWLPRKTFIAQSLQAGRFPLWDPTFRCGLPFFANPDNGVLDLFALPFDLFPFADALKLFHLFSFLAAFLACYLLAKGRKAANAGALFFALLLTYGGYFLVRSQFLSQISTLVWCLWSGALLFSGALPFLSLPIALSIFAGHGQTLIIFWCFALPLYWAGKGKAPMRPFWRAMLIAAGLAAVQILPCLELSHLSQWGTQGLAAGRETVHSLAPRDLLHLLYNPRMLSSLSRAGLDNVFWVQSFQIGIFPALLALWAFLRAPVRQKLIFGSLIAASCLLALGSSTPVSAFLFRRLGFLDYIRYPTRWILGACALLAWLAAIGYERLNPRWRRGIAALALIQLLWGWWRFLPVLPADYLRARGDLAAFLQTHLKDGRRFLLSFKAERTLVGQGADFAGQMADLRDRLYIRLPLLYRLPEAGGFGEPLTPLRMDEFLDRTALMPSPDLARPYLSRMAVSDLLAPGTWPGISLRDEGRKGWELYHNDAALPRAYWMDEKDFIATQDWGAERKNILPVAAGFGEDKIVLQGRAPREGVALLADVAYPGWEAYADGKRALIAADGGVFRAARVPKDFTLVWIYRPHPFLWGLALSGASLAALGLLTL